MTLAQIWQRSFLAYRRAATIWPNRMFGRHQCWASRSFFFDFWITVKSNNWKTIKSKEHRTWDSKSFFRETSLPRQLLLRKNHNTHSTAMNDGHNFEKTSGCICFVGLSWWGLSFTELRESISHITHQAKTENFFFAILVIQACSGGFLKRGC